MNVRRPEEVCAFHAGYSAAFKSHATATERQSAITRSLRRALFEMTRMTNHEMGKTTRAIDTQEDETNAGSKQVTDIKEVMTVVRWNW